MSDHDFFNDPNDRLRASPGRSPVGPSPDAVETLGGASTRDEVRSISDYNITRLARHKHQVSEQSAAALQELDRLKKRQEQLEQEKRELEDLRRKHEEFERGKREMTDHLKRSLVSLEREEAELGRRAELLAATRTRFKELLEGLEAIREETWAEPEIRDQLNRSLTVIESSRMEYHKAMGKVDAAKGIERGAAAPATGPAVTDAYGEVPDFTEKPLAFWIKLGFAISLPVVVTLLVLGLLILVGAAQGWFIR